MAHVEKTVFISYRRTDVYEALSVYQDLTSHGYDAFFDYRNIASGDFAQIILGNIRARAHFVLILTPTALERCNQPGDWLRREIETAMDEKRNIVPLFFNGFSFGNPSVKEKLTGKLRKLSKYNGLNVYEDYFDAAMGSLREQYLHIPLDTVLHPVSAKVRKVVKEEQLAADQALHGRAEKAEPKPEPRKRKLAKPDPKTKSKPEIQPTVRPSRTKKTTRDDHFIYTFGEIEFVKVPSGEFRMGSKASNKVASKHEMPQFIFNIPYHFFMARFPVTNEEFEKFVNATLYSTYAEEVAYGYKWTGARVKKIDGANWKHPHGPKSDIDSLSRHPVVQVAWKDGLAYFDWLTKQFGRDLPRGYVFRAPTEAEWEKSARGSDRREYPWGSEFVSDFCNSREDGQGTTTSVGTYSPQGDSAYQVCDMAGNVWEWTSSLWGNVAEAPDYRYPYDPRDGRENVKASDEVLRVVRGGSFLDGAWDMRAANRSWYNPIIGLGSCGLRVVIAPRNPWKILDYGPSLLPKHV